MYLQNSGPVRLDAIATGVGPSGARNYGRLRVRAAQERE